MNNNRITNPNNNIVRDCKSRTTENYWNSQSDKYSYVVKNNSGSEMRYKVNFELEAVQKNKFDPDKHKSTNTNIYRVVDDSDLSTGVNGKAMINRSRVKESQKEESTGAHEIGHTLGIDDLMDGIMAGENGNRSDKMIKDNVKGIIGNAFQRKQDNVGVGNIIEKGESPKNFRDKNKTDVITN